MSQSKRASLMEALTNIVVGYGVNFLANLFIFPLFGWELSVRDNLTIGVFYTLISLVRSYVLRRIYNSLSPKSNYKMFSFFKKQKPSSVADVVSSFQSNIDLLEGIAKEQADESEKYKDIAVEMKQRSVKCCDESHRALSVAKNIKNLIGGAE